MLSQLIHIFWNTLLNKMGNNCEFDKKKTEMMVLSSFWKQRSAYAFFSCKRCLKWFGSNLAFIK